MNDIRENLSKELEITIDITDLNEHLLNELEAVIINSPGKCNLKIQLTDIESGIKTDLLSKKYLINPDNELFNALNQFESLKVNLLGRKIEVPKNHTPEFKKYVKV